MGQEAKRSFAALELLHSRVAPWDEQVCADQEMASVDKLALGAQVWAQVGNEITRLISYAPLNIFGVAVSCVPVALRAFETQLAMKLVM